MHRLGRYDLGELLGEGGNGRVFRAIQHGPGGLARPVALKLMTRGTGGLEREARLGGLLRHVHLVDVYEVGRVDGTWFCAMELCKGGAIAGKLPLPPRAVVEVGLQVCEALAYAHRELGLVHLDLKPQNLLLDGAVVKVADLGIANATGFEGDGRVRGTLGYMPPEQLGGGRVDARTDVYALGVVLFELATARRPGASETYSMDDDFVEPVGVLAFDLVPWLAPILERCVAELPVDRYPNMDALAADLRALNTDGPGLADHLGVTSTAALEGRTAARTNLGPEPDAFVGREPELAALADALVPGAVVLLKGPGGIGKTRLALAAARALGEATGDQAWWVDLSTARTAIDAVLAIAATLGVALGDVDLDAAASHVGRALTGRGRPVLVLDNLEQLGDAARLVARLAAAAPTTRLLLTSRERIEVGGPTLEVEALDEARAVDLLVRRALQRGVALEPGAEVLELARRLEGVPLALELAAGRLGVLSPAEVLERLGLSLLRSGRREAGDRQATLRATLDWSWELLSPPERTALAQLSVFRGGFTLVAAELVLRCDRSAVDVVDALVARSWVSTRDGRLRLLDVVRAYAEEQLEDPAAVALRHGAWAARLGAPEALDALNHHGGLPRRRALTAERDNLVAACRAALGRRDPAVFVPVLAALAEVVDLHGGAAHALDDLDAALAQPLAPADRARLLLVAARTARLAGRFDRGERDVTDALAAVEALADPRLEVDALRIAGVVWLTRGAWERAEHALRRGVALARELGAVDLEGMLLGNLGHLRLRLGDADEAHACAQGALTCARKVGNRRGEAIVLGNLALVLRNRGDGEAALDAMRTALAIHRESTDRRFEGLTLSNIGSVYTDLGRTEEAIAALSGAAALHRELGNRELYADTTGNLGRALHDHGDVEAARAAYLEALALHEEIGERMWQGLEQCNLGMLDLEGDDLVSAAWRLETAEALTTANADALWTAVVQGCRARLALVAGRFEEARTLAERSVAALEGVHAQALALSLQALAEARGALGEPHQDLLDRAEALQREGGWELDQLEAWSARARVAFRAGDVATGTAWLDRVVACADRRGLGARAPLRHAIAWARRCAPAT